MISPKLKTSALEHATQLKRNELFRYLLELKKEKFKFTYIQRGFHYQDTGFNDKYAYGIATKKVQLGRGNKEGNNAFTYDDNNYSNNRLHYE